MEKEQLFCGRRKIQINCVLNPHILFYFVKSREDHSKWLYDNSLRILLLYENIFVTCIVLFISLCNPIINLLDKSGLHVYY